MEAAALYAERIARFRAVALKRGPGIDPDVVARAVEHALTAPRPKARYLVGRDAHLRAWIERLPTRLRDRVLAKALPSRDLVAHAARPMDQTIENVGRRAMAMEGALALESVAGRSLASRSSVNWKFPYDLRVPAAIVFRSRGAT